MIGTTLRMYMPQHRMDLMHPDMLRRSQHHEERAQHAAARCAQGTAGD